MDQVEEKLKDFQLNVNAAHQPPCPRAGIPYRPIGDMPDGTLLPTESMTGPSVVIPIQNTNSPLNVAPDMPRVK